MKNVSKQFMASKVSAGIIAGALVAGFVASPAFATEQTEPSINIESSEINENVSGFNPAVIAACNMGLGDTVVAAYTTSAFGQIKLLCGDSASGYVHIRTGHAGQWQQIIDAVGEGGDWDDLMNFAVKQSLAAPAPGYPQNLGSGKYCYTTPISVYNSRGQLVKNLNPTIVISANNQKVITAFPTTSAPSCNAS
ncbi:hypothetical protein M2118_000309 [Aurantimicrobium minutum]|uniref:hypothetical protein n=1 Tax=Aurantimicrobium minutum TaxID=708131 RepID=UPI0024744915|nr:hypothetical protein [Aurantimicrobium minutum]MDH6277358.1 hypothetical protein [Aurantimicrobium minutum]